MRIAVIIVGLGVGAPRVADAYRPFDQTDADTAAVDTIELELGPLQATHGGGETELDPGGVFNYGFAPGWELVVDLDASIPTGDPGSTLVPTDVLVKHVLRDGSLQERTGPSVAIELGPLLPSLPSLSDEAGWSTAVIVSQRFASLTIHVNGLVEWTRDRAVAVTGGAIIEGPEHWRVRPVAEGYVSRERDANLYSGLVGAIWRYRDHLAFDAALRLIRNDQAENVQNGLTAQDATSAEIRIGLTWVIPT